MNSNIPTYYTAFCVESDDYIIGIIERDDLMNVIDYYNNPNEIPICDIYRQLEPVPDIYNVILYDIFTSKCKHIRKIRKIRLSWLSKTIFHARISYECTNTKQLEIILDEDDLIIYKYHHGIKKLRHIIKYVNYTHVNNYV